MTHVPESKVVEPLQQVLNSSDDNPLDILNKWWVGQLDNDAFFVLMQRAVLTLQSRAPVFANAEAFAKARNQVAVEMPRKQQLVNSVLDHFERINGYRLSMSDERFNLLVEYAGRMLEDGMRYGPFAAVNLARGRYAMFLNYAGGKKFKETLEEAINGNNE